MKNSIYFRDNLEILREFPDNSVDCGYADLPFNSGRNYNIFLPNSQAQTKAFTDIWRWNGKASLRWKASTESFWIKNRIGLHSILQIRYNNYTP